MVAKHGAGVRLAQPVYHANDDFSHFKVTLHEGHGRLAHKVAINAAGRVVPRASAEREYERENRKRSGSLTPDSARMLAAASDEDLFDAVMWIDVTRLDERGLHEALAPYNTDVKILRKPPAMVSMGRVPARALEAAARIKGAVSTTAFLPSKVVNYHVPGSGALHTHARETLNSITPGCGFSGAGVNVGIHEYTSPSTLDGWTLRELHESIKRTPPFSTFEYYTQKRACIIGNPAAGCGSDSSGEIVCVDGYCTNKHASQVSSRVGVSFVDAQTPFYGLAWLSNLKISNVPAFQSPADLVAVLDWFVNTQTLFVNESFGVEVDDGPTGLNSPPYSYHALITDWYSRNQGLTFIQATGNASRNYCHGMNKVCVGRINSDPNKYLFSGQAGIYNYSENYLQDPNDPSILGDVFDPSISGHANPGRPLRNNNGIIYGYETEQIARPDIVSEGVDVGVMSLNQSVEAREEWDFAGGTSFSAPVVTGLLALMQEACGYPRNSASWRALLRTSANWNHKLFRDPTTGDGVNNATYPADGMGPLPGGVDNIWYAGTGIADARLLCLWCSSCCLPDPGSGEPSRAEGEEETDFSESDWDQVPSYALTPGDPAGDVVSLADVSDNQVPNTYRFALKNELNKWRKIWQPGHPVTRVRFSLTFYSCSGPVDAEYHNVEGDINNVLYEYDSYNNTPATDFDLIMCSDSEGICYVESISEDSSNEGFDYYFSNESPEDIAVYLVAPDGAQVCATYNTEPYSWATFYWHN